MPLFDRKDKSRYAAFTRRTLMTGGAIGAVLGVLGVRLYQLQILEGDQFRTKAEENSVSVRLVAPLRGRIFDRFGVELATNRRNYRVLIIPEQALEGVDEAIDTVGKIILLSDRDRDRIMRDIANNKKFVATTIAENLTWEQFARLNLHLPYLSGIQPDVGQTRDYPFGEELSHVLGYVAAASQSDQQSDSDPLLALPGFRIGKRGIEKSLEKELRGSAGVSRVEVNAYGRVIRELSRDSGAPGDDVWLTLDRDLQKFVVERMGDESCAIAVMDVATGDVLALASTPGYDPNLFNVGITQAEWKGLLDNDHRPLSDKALSGLYPPGSTFKPAVALAALDAGAITPQFAVNCSGSLAFGNYVFHCWKKGGHGHVDLHRGITQSCDVFFYNVARRLGIDGIEAGAHRLGFGKQTGIEIPGERAGVIPGRAWKEATFGAKWLEGETLNAGIGQGYVLVTPLQLCTMSARIASGKLVSPRIIRVVGKEGEPRPELPPLPFAQSAIDAVRSGMNGVANEPGGTAFGWRITEPGFEMAGKTGSAQVRKISLAEHLAGVTKNEKLPWKLRDHALFVAYAPVAAPRYACSVVIEHGRIGQHPDVQMARDILLYVQQRDPVKRSASWPVNAAGLDRDMTRL
ncbi:MAG TPA: penicillin-binding protein 2 [Rhizomicrobium sp.]|jgi:penicillin-binding protein 2|nr:penicillin-binding protein 2 [Rhizomicrobium sp.]